MKSLENWLFLNSKFKILFKKVLKCLNPSQKDFVIFQIQTILEINDIRNPKFHHAAKVFN